MNDASAQIFAIALAATWCGFGLYGVVRKFGLSPQAREMLRRFRQARLSTKAALAAGLLAAVAVGGTKPGGTNDPPRGMRPPAASRDVRTRPEAASPAFAPVEVRMNNVSFRAESASAVEVEDWRRHGSSSGGVWLDFGAPVFRIGTNPVSRAHVAASGVLSFDSIRRPPVGAPLPDGTGLPALVPFLAPLGMVPEANWTNAGAASRFWHDTAPGRSRVLTWEEALLDRLPGRRVSVQAELQPSGDFTYRYDFADALDPPATNLVIGAQVGTNGVNALAILGTNLLTETVWRVDGARVTNGVSIADLLCTNGVLRTPARFAIEWMNTSGIDSNADTDGDGLSDWDEVFLHGTDPAQADTDGDGLSDLSEAIAGANPLDADEDGDGVPDGFSPANFPGSRIVWSAEPDGRVEFVNGENTGRQVEVRGLSAGFATLSARIMGYSGPGLELEIGVVEKQTVPVRAFIVGDGAEWATDEATVRGFLPTVNKIWRQAGIEFGPLTVERIENRNWFQLKENNYSWPEAEELCATAQNTGGVEWYFVKDIESEADAFDTDGGTVFSRKSTSRTIAHEMGHVLGLSDIYSKQSFQRPDGIVETVTVLGVPTRNRLESDWGSSGEEGYYAQYLTQYELVARLIMNGTRSGLKGDISAGPVDGIVRVDRWDPVLHRHVRSFELDGSPIGFFSAPNFHPEHEGTPP